MATTSNIVTNKNNEPIDLKSKSLYARLKRLFSTDVVVRNVGGKKLKVVDTDNVMYATDRNTLRDRFNRVRTSGYSQYSRDFTMAYAASRIELFRDYDVMDMDPIISAALDIYADETTSQNELGRVLTVSSSDDNIKNILENLFIDIINVEFNLWSWVRNMVKYGDFYLKLHISPEYGIYMVEPLSSYNVQRIENSDPNNKAYTKFQVSFETGVMEELENHQIAHFRLISDSNFAPYGKSLIEGARRVWKQLSLLEDAMLIHRIMRAPEKRVFKIDIGNIPPQEIDTYMEKLIAKTKKVPYIDDKTGDYNLRFNLQNMVEDFYIPVRGSDSGTSIEPLSGMEFTGIDDIEYVRNKMLAALKIPKAYLSFEEDLCIVPETKIPLLNGKTKTVRELIEDYNKGIKNYVYSIDENTKNIVPGEIEWAGWTRKNAKVVRVWLDNNEYIDCTPDHNFMNRDGTWTEAQNLKCGQSLMPLYLNETNYKLKKGYTTVYNPSDNNYKEVHRLVSEHYGLIKQRSEFVVHHKDFDKKNNYPDNLDCSMNWYNHKKYHSLLTEKTVNSKENIEKRINDSNRRQSCKKGGKIGGIKSGKRSGEWIIKNGPKNKGQKEGCIKTCPQCNNTFYTFKSNNHLVCCSRECANKYFISEKRYNTKFNISFEKLIECAGKSKSFKELEVYLGNIDRNTLNRAFLYNGIIDKKKFVDDYMQSAKSDKVFMNKLIKNHKVSYVESLATNVDTCDIRIKQYHNFAVSSGVFIHNSGKATLAAEDLRFAKTIHRIQKIIVSELNKLAVIHLYAQGYNDENLTNFKLELTNPSTILEKEKIDVWSNKMSVVKDMLDTKTFSSDFVYKNVFKLTDADITTNKNQIVEDVKRAWRLKQIEEEGNDPVMSLQSVNKDGSLSDVEGGDSGGGDAGGGDMGGGEAGGGEAGGGEAGGGEAGGGEVPSLKEIIKDNNEDRPSQKGYKKEHYGDKYSRFGEDPLGTDELNRDVRNNLNPAHKYKYNSPLGLNEVDSIHIKNMAEFLKSNVKRELLGEIKTSKSLKSLINGELDIDNE